MRFGKKNLFSFLDWRKDGGEKSTVSGFFFIAIKPLFSIVLLRFDGDSREAFHTHAFHCISWVVKGELHEEMRDGRTYTIKPSFLPFLTTRKDFHKVSSVTPESWVFSIRGPWKKEWMEHLPLENRDRTLTHGRVEIA
jgi:hypothetical protein